MPCDEGDSWIPKAPSPPTSEFCLSKVSSIEVSFPPSSLCTRTTKYFKENTNRGVLPMVFSLSGPLWAHFLIFLRLTFKSGDWRLGKDTCLTSQSFLFLFISPSPDSSHLLRPGNCFVNVNDDIVQPLPWRKHLEDEGTQQVQSLLEMILPCLT